MEAAAQIEAPPPDFSSAPGAVVADGEEAREVGHVRWGVYGAYVAAIGRALTFTILSSLLLMQVGVATANRA